MALTIQVISYNDHAPINALSTTISESGCTIGRAKNNGFILPDEERIISHQHATIQYENGAYYLIDSSTNGTYLNHAQDPIGSGNKILLHDGDILSMGKYECVVSMKEQEQEIPISLFHDAIIQPPHHQMADQSSSANDLFGGPVSVAPVQTSEEQPLSIEQNYFRPPEAIPENWNELTGMKQSIQPQLKSAPVQPIIKSKQTPPRPVANKKQVDHVTPKGYSNNGKISNSSQQAINAFLDGAGMKNTTIRPDDVVRFMNTAGRVLYEITQGVRQILDSRANLKGEFRLGMTTLRPAKNNPLKFSIDIEDALTKLLLPPPKGYLPPLDAIHEAVDDIQAHQMALLAGLRAALSTLVAHFDPEKLERNFQQSSAVDNLLPALKKAKYWEMFKTRYKQAAADAENDFLNFLGKEFTLAYEQQVEKLKSVRHKSNL